MADRNAGANVPIRVGIIGLNPDAHWGAMAHLPALSALPGDFTVVGVANRSAESARRAADAFGLRHAFADARALVESPDVDLVTIAVKVPHHQELVAAALGAGKHVYCEWPLGNGLAEARDMAALAAAKGVVAAVGTQMRVAPAVVYLKRLVAEGYVGRVLSTTLVGSGLAWGESTDTAHAYLFDRTNGATMLTIPVGHVLAGLRDVLGEVGPVSAQMITQRATVHVADTGETLPVTSPDQVMVHGVMESGAALSLHYRGGLSRGTNFLWEINGTEGDLQMTAPSGHGQLAPLTLRGARGDATELAPLPLPADALEGWPADPVAGNVARLYALIARDIREGTRTAPSFADAVALHRVIDAIERSAVARTAGD